MTRPLCALALILSGASAASPYRFGLDQAQCGWAGGCYVTAYFDLNRTNGVVRDWACGTKTYDNHTGIDFGVGGFPGMDQGRDVLAAQAGTVTATHDGEFDRCTSGACGAPNYVWVKHADGQTSLYYHLKKGSVAVAVGQQVGCGQKLGQVGSSGYSTGPHLHFQTNIGTAFDDPYAGSTTSCGGAFSWWISQGSYGGLPGFACPAPPMPDVVVTAVSWSPGAPVEGDAVTFSATVKNQGAGPTPAVVGVAFQLGGVVVSSGTVPAMPAGATATVTATTGPSGPMWQAIAGTHTVVAAVDDANHFAETDEGNNQRTISLVVAGRADLTVLELSFEPAAPAEGTRVTFSATVKNQGNAPTASEAGIAFSIDGAEAARAAVPAALAPGESLVVRAETAWTAVRGAHFLEAFADDQATLVEQSEGNNLRTVPLEVSPPVAVPIGPIAPIAPAAGKEAGRPPTDSASPVTGGCGCGSGSTPGLLAIAVVALLRRRRPAAR